MVSNVVIVTGNSKGIGRYLTEEYLENGWMVVGCSRGATTLAHQNYIHYCLDVSNEEEVAHCVRGVVERYEKIDVLINNAGSAAMNHFLTTPLDSLRKLIDTNLIGTFLFSREVSKQMMRKKYGRIINFSTVAVPMNLEGEAAYVSSKAAIESLTCVMAKELAIYNITVNAIGPTPINTDLIKAVPENKIKELLSSQAIKRIGLFEDVKNVVDFYVSKQSAFVTGQKIYLGGVM